MSGPGGTERSKASLEDLFETLRKQNPELKSANGESSGTSIFGQQSFQQDHSRTSSRAGSLNPVSFQFGSYGHTAPHQTAQFSGYHPVSVSSPVETPPPIGRQPRHDSAIISPAASTPAVSSSPAPNAGMAASDRTTNLLNLLKFAQPSSSGARPSAVTATSQPQVQVQVETGAPQHPDGAIRGMTSRENQAPHGQGISASDLVASIMGKAGAPGPRASPSPSIGLPRPDMQSEAVETSSSSATQPRDVLLKLLSRHKPSQGETPAARQFSVGGDGTPPDRMLDAHAVTERLSQDVVRAPLDNIQATSVDDKPATPTKSEPFVTHHVGEHARQSSRAMTASPRERTPRAESSRSVVAPTYNILKRPGTATPEHVSSDTHKRKSKESSPGSEHASTRRKLASSSDRLSSTRSSPRPAPSTDVPGPFKAVTGLGGTDKATETVSEALKEVAEKVDRQVEDALANVNGKIDIEIKEEASSAGNDHLKDIERKIESVAAEMMPGSSQADEKVGLEETRPTATATDGVDATEQDVNEPAGDSWESADGEDSPAKDEERTVQVYNFPMKPFVSLTIKPAPARVIVSFKRETILDIARLKKEFDQIDRTLATASKQYIIYAMVKHGGFRIIRQDTGRDHQVFGKSEDRVFNVISSTGSLGESSFEGEAVFGTGISGSVYWVGLSGPEKVFWSDAEVESSGFVLPPIPGHGDSVSKGQLKTRAKKSARHPEYFAVGRGKAIYIIWPSVAQHPKYLRNKKERIVDVDKYIADRSLKISTGKAGKDFTFSEDDTTIATLDKAGLLKIWDVRKLVDESNGKLQDSGSSKITPIEIKTPLMELATNSPSERPWPSSVLFVDKHRSYMKGTASRYLILGMKQNHTLQLWDLALGKPVQEVHFPHDNEADGICSISYHSSSGIIIVGHPTRNSIYFLTLSAPKYSLPSMSQAMYVERLVQKDQSMTKVDVTAIITVIREYSLGSMGQLRSVEILSQPSSVSDDSESPVLFEMYVMHSKGVSCISVKAKDMGCSKEGRALRPADAVKEGLVTVSELQAPQPIPVTEDTQPVTEKNHREVTSLPTTIPKAAIKETPKKFAATASVRLNELPTPKGPSIPTSSSQVLSNGALDQGGPTADKVEKKKKKRGGVTELPWRAKDDKHSLSTNSIPSLPHGQTGQRAKALESPTRNDPAVSQGAKGKLAMQMSPTKAGPSTPPLADTPSINNTVSGSGLGKETEKGGIKATEDFAKIVSAETKKLHDAINEDRRIHEATFNTKMEAVLRLVSSILTDNTEKALARIIAANINKSVVPTIKETIPKILDQELTETLRDQTNRAVADEVKKGLPEGVRQALENPKTLQDMSDLVANKVATHVESEFAAVVTSTISPAFKEFTLNTVKKMGADVESRVAEQMSRFEERHRNDAQKIEALQEAIRSLMQMVSRMAGAQADFQKEILRGGPRQPTLSGETRQPEIGNARTGRSQIGSLPIQQSAGRSSSINAGSVRPGSFSAASIQPTAALPVPVQPASVLPAALQSTAVQPGYVQPTLQSMYGQTASIPPSSTLQSTLATTQPPRPVPTGQSLQGRLGAPANSAEQMELDAITGLMSQLRYEEATVKANIFNKLFVFMSPTYLQSVSALVVLSVAATVASTFESHVAERIQWLEYCFICLNPKDPDIRELIPRIMDVLIERLEALYIEVAKENLHDPVLTKIPNLTDRARQIQQSV
ncbi:MAG: hypothetical protein M1816_003125 [Peltula sp. TS41687]|nr:MAG: hypothetical protein M1816_003125 [Peltula sp. TS41687]